MQQSARSLIPEKTICELFSSRLPSGRLNDCFESDAEIIRLHDQPCLFTTDEFSAEDLFREEEAYLLGWNIAAGAISDIFACGGTPLYYAHALTVPPHWDTAYIEHLSDGVRDVLLASGTRFIGGDCGRSKLWRCTASVIGLCEGTPVRRRGAQPGDRIYLTGEIGAGNLEAALCLSQSDPPPEPGLRAWAKTVRTQFPVRFKESALLRKYASAAIDTSDGVWQGLEALANINGCGYSVGPLPYAAAGLRFGGLTGQPKTLLFLGECGEYELMFTVRPDRETALREQAQSSGCRLFCLGEMTPTAKTLREEGRMLDLSTLEATARACDSPREYLETLGRWLKRSG